MRSTVSKCLFLRVFHHVSKEKACSWWVEITLVDYEIISVYHEIILIDHGIISEDYMLTTHSNPDERGEKEGNAPGLDF